MEYKLTIIGVVEDGFTSAEISDEKDEMVARVFELDRGWYVELQDPERLRDQGLVDAVLAAKATLLHYVNRRGGDLPEGMSNAAVSLWLMQRDDGKGFTIPSEPAGREE